ncbi:hypothetical protein [Chryseobacterium tongliaoense]|uniref:hypothetical protein n=1 Tax=Chryseobacterium tongliaoense TaxID=3240933 RepID=UPI0035159A41
METLEKRRSIIDHIFEDLGNLKKEDLMAIANFSASLSKIISKDKQTDEDALYLLKFFKQEDPIPADEGQAAINLYNEQKFGYLQKRFKILPDLVDFLLQEKNDKIDIFLVERKREDDIPCLDIAYKNSANGEYYYVDNVRGGVIMTDFTNAQNTFENNCKKKLDIGQNPNKYTCPTKIMIDKSHFVEFKKFEVGKSNPKIHLTTGINLDKTQNDFFKRVTLVMNFGQEKDGIHHPDMNYYFDTYHLCPPGTC